MVHQLRRSAVHIPAGEAIYVGQEVLDRFPVLEYQQKIASDSFLHEFQFEKTEKKTSAMNASSEFQEMLRAL